MSVRAKFHVRSVEDFGQSKIVRFYPVADDDIPENQRYHQYTPSGSLEMTINNPPAAEFFKPGQDYYLDFTPVEKPAETPA
ncbi:MAG TPA: hypothetical protein VIC84_06840 [Blastocatellia bacterium]|jgi:hypothetical protein